jgi:endonuclease/exonuclease/phosphatase (EEP) superfamily protein YafD
MISVLSYNVYFGKRLDKIIFWLLKKPTFDVICFQEFPKKVIPIFIKAFSQASYGYRFAPFLQKRGITYGELTLFRKDKLTFLSSTTVSLGINRGERVMLRARIPRTSLLTIFRYKKQKIALVNIHLVNVAFNILRYKQITQIVNRLDHHAMPVVLLGDFNMPSVFGRKKLFSMMEENGFEFIRKRLSTFHLVGVKYQMDYIFWKGCKVTGLSVERVKFSDHYPVAFTVSLRYTLRNRNCYGY